MRNCEPGSVKLLRAQVPVWPFVSASFAFGIFAILPYLCVWQPRVGTGLAPPVPSELEQGFGSLVLRGLESRWLPASSLLSAAGLLTFALTAGVPQWNAYIQLFDESKFIHMMSIDFALCTAMTPFFLSLDADARRWQPRAVAVPVLALIPLLGPLLYLLLRPVTSTSAPDVDVDT